jgi:dihydrofolate reductase
MRDVIYAMTVSLDGFIAGPRGEIDWSAPDPELHLFHNDRIRETGVQLMGRGLYEAMVVWETGELEPLTEAPAREFAELWKPLPKIVFSTTLESVEGNATLARDGVAEEIARLQEEPGKAIAVGGAGLAATCTELGLIDEYPVLPAGGPADRPGAGRDADIRLPRRVPPVPAGVSATR